MKTSLALILGIVLGTLIGWGLFSGDLSSQTEGENPETNRTIRISNRSHSASSSSSASSHTSPKKSQTTRPLLQQISDIRTPWGSGNALYLTRLNSEIAQLTSPELVSFLAELELLEEDDNLWSDPLEDFSKVAILRLIELEGFSALNDLAEGEKFPQLSERWGDDIIASGVAIWTAQDPQEVKKWFLDTITKERNDETISDLADYFTEDEVLASFVLTYEQGHPDGIKWLTDELGPGEGNDLITRISLEGQVRASKDPAHLTRTLSEAIKLPLEETATLIETAMKVDPQTTAQWVSDLQESPQRNSALMKVGEQLLSQNRNDPSGSVDWFFGQKISDSDMKMARLKTFQRSFQNDFISPVNVITIPGIPAPENTDLAIDRSSIDHILSNPNRTAESSEQFLTNLRKTAEKFSDGQFRELIEQEIQALGLEEPQE